MLVLLHANVAVTIPEVLRLADHIRETWSLEDQAALRLRTESYMKAPEAWRSADRSRQPRPICPLLDRIEGTCSVWSERPIVCRGVNSTDRKACITKRDDPVNDPAVPQIMGQFYASMYSRTGMRQGLKKHGLDERMYEMIPALIIALDHPDAADRYLS